MQAQDGLRAEAGQGAQVQPDERVLRHGRSLEQLLHLADDRNLPIPDHLLQAGRGQLQPKYSQPVVLLDHGHLLAAGGLKGQGLVGGQVPVLEWQEVGGWAHTLAE